MTWVANKDFGELELRTSPNFRTSFFVEIANFTELQNFFQEFSKDIGLSSDSLSLQHVAGSGGRSRQSGRAGVLRLLVEVPKVPVVSCFQFGRKTAPNARLALD